jgi:hypothetical protein
MSLQFWTVYKGTVALTPEGAGKYVSRQIGLEARKLHSSAAMASFADPKTAVTEYNTELGKLEILGGEQFAKFYEKAYGLGYSEDMAKNYATKRAADWMEAELELLNLQRPFVGSTDMMINAQIGAPVLGQSMRIQPDSTIPVDVQQRVPIRGQAIAGAQPKKTPAKRGRGRK